MQSGDSVQALIDNGYWIIPIKKNSKMPMGRGWQDLRIKDSGELPKGCGIGILTGVGVQPVCGVDIDSTDVGLVTRFSEWCREVLGADTPLVRVGKAPKQLILCQAAEGYSKVSSRAFYDIGGGKHQLEILGTGQQFVAYGVHPDTGGKYTWPGNTGPVGCAVGDLPMVDSAMLDAMLAEFEEMATAAGFEPRENAVGKAQGAARRSARSTGPINGAFADHPLMAYEPPLGISEGEAAMMLNHLDDDYLEDYNKWVSVGMALHHEYSGGPEGLELWHTWSLNGSTYKSLGDLKHRWGGFDSSKDGVITMRTIRHMAGDYGRAHAQEETHTAMEAAMERVRACEKPVELIDTILPDISREFKGRTVLLNSFETAIKKRYESLTDVKITATALRKQMHDVVRDDKKEAISKPQWANGWIFVVELNKFYHVKKGIFADQQAFSASYTSELGAGGGVGEDGEYVSAASFVLNNNLIPKADRLMYFPSQGPLFRIDGVNYANTYHKGSALDLAAGEDGDESEEGGAVALFKRHVSLLVHGVEPSVTGRQPIGLGREAQLLTNFLRWTVEHPGRRITWATLLQGEMGDGKTEPFMRLMCRLLGRRNVSVVNAVTIEKSPFNEWAEGTCFTMLEEIKLHGHNRYDVTNKLKPVIANDIVEIHPKGRRAYAVTNTTNYFITTNYKDAVPMEIGDRRYFILFSKFPSGVRLNSKYFEGLFDAIESDTGCKAIGRWLLSVPYHPDFKPKGRAPLTADRGQAIEYTQCDEIEELREILADSESPYFNNEIVAFGHLKSYMEHEGMDLKNSAILARWLVSLDFISLGRHRLPGDVDISGRNKRQRLWIKNANKANVETFMNVFEVMCLMQ